ncbi:hypothetical protein EWB00_000796 [Schistosoma japonicum]|uniref:Uncharacterized protein n=1 Tax=Schistosoma japonicum TaxID=6182 RepID=A0A4Z2CK73_SCHJA|nr:hypothetical protein EWB00_000796 [Schistosoma japonicum]
MESSIFLAEDTFLQPDSRPIDCLEFRAMTCLHPPLRRPPIKARSCQLVIQSGRFLATPLVQGFMASHPFTGMPSPQRVFD